MRPTSCCRPWSCGAEVGRVSRPVSVPHNPLPGRLGVANIALSKLAAMWAIEELHHGDTESTERWNETLFWIGKTTVGCRLIVPGLPVSNIPNR